MTFPLLLALLLPSARASQQSGTPLTADAAVSTALERAPEVARAAGLVEAAAGARRGACGLREDPTLAASAALVGEAWSLSLSQPLSLSGEGLAACEAARHALEAAEARAARARLEVAARARRVWADAVAAERQALLAEEGLVVAGRVETAARQRAAVGEASLLELRLARLRVEEARTAWMVATVAEGERLGELAALLGTAPGALVLPEDPLAGLPLGRVGAGEPRRSDVVAAEADLAAARAEGSRQRAATLPPVSLGAFVEEEGPELRAGPTLSVRLPVWSGNVDGRAAARAAEEVAAAELAATRAQASAERGAAAAVSRSLEAALRDQPADLPGEARAALESVALGYDRGELDLLSVAWLQERILAGHGAWIEGRRVAAGAGIARLLAEEDPVLLGP